MMRICAAVLLTCACWCGASAQESAPDNPTGTPQKKPETAAASPRFEAADVHVSAPDAPAFTQFGRLAGERFTMLSATLPQMIGLAYGYKSRFVFGGPVWLEMDRYDVIAKAPVGTSQANLNLMIQALLKERFALVEHEGLAPMPAHQLQVKGDLKLKPSTSDDAGGCNFKPQEGGAPQMPPAFSFVCKNETMAKFADFVQSMGNGYIQAPVVDATGLKGGYDFEFRFTPQQGLATAGADGVTLFDALDKLGLKMPLGTSPRPAIIVDSVNETPMPNPPDTEKLLPKAPDVQFDVATIKPSRPDERGQLMFRGDLVDAKSIPLKILIVIAWNLSFQNIEALSGTQPWMDSDKYDITAKVASEDMAGKPVDPRQLDISVMRKMLQGLIADRFHMKYHTEIRPVAVYTLVAAGPKLKSAADPSQHMRCDEAPGPDGKDPRKTNPLLNKLYWCQNLTMDAFAKELRFMAPDLIYYPVANATGIKGSYDFALSYSTVGNGRANGGLGVPPPPEAVTQASDPSGAVDLFDAVKGELGLKLEKTMHDEPVLVIDHIDEQPEAN
jgi:uncharacterized protein (TIGR03435 family)